MTSRSLVFVGLLLYVSAAVVVPWLAVAAVAADEISNIGGKCERSCGAVDIPFPFGMGPDHCMLTPDFKIECIDTGAGSGVRSMVPFLNIFTGIQPPEVRNISLEQGEAHVTNPTSSYCYNNDTSSEVRHNEERWDLRNTPYTFSSTANKFTVVGCRALAYISNANGSASSSAKYQTGCVSMCFPGNMDLKSCSGMGCCQMAIPKGLKYYDVWFDRSLDIDGRGEGLFDTCSFAVLVDSSNFSLSSAISEVLGEDVNGSWWSSSNFRNISMDEYVSVGGTKAPVVLDWSIGDDGCKTASRNPGYACVSDNSNCSDAASGRGYICKCNKGFDGNPYLPNGCQDIDECRHLDKYTCYGDCTNTKGSFKCTCPRGTLGNASYAECRKDHFPPVARVATGISAGLLVALIVILSTLVYRNKKSKKIQQYFEQHGGRMLLRILETDGNIAFTLYDRRDLVKATRRFHKDNIIGEGAHGTVYKAILGGEVADASTTTVAVKTCKQIDESRTSEFVQELVVLCRVNHPNVVRLLGCCLHFEAPMLVYEFAPNGTLSDLLYGKHRRQVMLSTRLRIAAETAEALAHLHSPPHPTLHGDVKPQNILLGDKWVAKVSDFGCSTINDNVQVVPKGTLAYLDPEFLKDMQITEKTDVYSFGVVLIELLTGKNPQAKKWKNLTTMFLNSMEGNGSLGDLLDADIVEEGSIVLISAAAQLLSRCIAVPGKTRPAMEQVAEELRRLSDQMPECSEALVALEVEDGRYSYTATESETTGLYI